MSRKHNYYDHGSIEFITDNNGAPNQFFLNTPFGENLENQKPQAYEEFYCATSTNLQENHLAITSW